MHAAHLYPVYTTPYQCTMSYPCTGTYLVDAQVHTSSPPHFNPEWRCEGAPRGGELPSLNVDHISTWSHTNGLQTLVSCPRCLLALCTCWVVIAGSQLPFACSARQTTVFYRGIGPTKHTQQLSALNCNITSTYD